MRCCTPGSQRAESSSCGWRGSPPW